jgi:glycosyltransferase involved in cell wall biosynthesis
VAVDSYPSKEIVVVDDGSGDQSVEIVETWARLHPQLPVNLIRQSHRGVIASRNRLIDAARGEFCAWLDSDDRLVEGGIAARVRYLLENPTKQAAFGDCRVIDADDRVLFQSGYRGYRNVNVGRFQTDRGLRFELITNWCLPGTVMMVRKDFYNQIGVYDETIAAHDFDFCLRALAQNALGYVGSVVCDYRVHPANISRQDPHRIALLSSFSRSIAKSVKKFPFFERCLLRTLALAAGTKGALMKRAQS